MQTRQCYFIMIMMTMIILGIGCSTSNTRYVDPELVPYLRGAIRPNKQIYELQDAITVNYVISNISDQEIKETIIDGSDNEEVAFTGYNFNAVSQENRNLPLILQKDGKPFQGDLTLVPGQEKIFCENIFKAKEAGTYLLSFDIRWKQGKKVTFRPMTIKVKNPPTVETLDPELSKTLQQLSSDNLEEREQAKEKLTIMGDVVAPHLIGLLAKDQTTAREATTVLLALDKEAMPTLIQATQNPNSEIRMRVIYIIGQIGGYSAIPVLANSLLHDPDQAVRIMALRMVSENTNEIATPLMIRALEDREEKVREEAISKLNNIHDRTFGFIANAPLEARQKAVEQWKNWWKETDPKAFSE